MEAQKSIFKILIAFLITSLLALIVTVNWSGCKMEDIVAPPSSITVSQIVNEIANANTQEKAIETIKHIIGKVGLGINVQGSSYANFPLIEEVISNLAANHVHYLNNGNNMISLGAFYDSIYKVSPHIWQLAGNKNQTFLRLKEKSSLILNNIETPDNSILLIIYAENGYLPSKIELIDTLSVISPIQTLIFGIWTFNEFKIENIADNVPCPPKHAEFCKGVQIGATMECLEHGTPGTNCLEHGNHQQDRCCHNWDQGSGGNGN
jgi:hypothetical protein